MLVNEEWRHFEGAYICRILPCGHLVLEDIAAFVYSNINLKRTSRLKWTKSTPHTSSFSVQSASSALLAFTASTIVPHMRKRHQIIGYSILRLIFWRGESVYLLFYVCGPPTAQHTFRKKPKSGEGFGYGCVNAINSYVSPTN